MTKRLPLPAVHPIDQRVVNYANTLKIAFAPFKFDNEGMQGVDHLGQASLLPEARAEISAVMTRATDSANELVAILRDADASVEEVGCAYASFKKNTDVAIAQMNRLKESVRCVDLETDAHKGVYLLRYSGKPAGMEPNHRETFISVEPSQIADFGHYLAYLKNDQPQRQLAKDRSFVLESIGTLHQPRESTRAISA